MPLFDYECDTCGQKQERFSSIAGRDAQACDVCAAHGKIIYMRRLLSAPYGRVAGRVLKGGGPDRFTADVLGYRLDELPTALRTDGTKREGD